MKVERTSFFKKKSKKRQCNEHEKKLAKKVGGLRQPNSGAVPGYPGDVRTKDFLLDLKETEFYSISLKMSDLLKLQKEADSQGKDPVLVLGFSKVKRGGQFAVIPLDIFNEMKGEN